MRRVAAVLVLVGAMMLVLPLIRSNRGPSDVSSAPGTLGPSSTAIDRRPTGPTQAPAAVPTSLQRRTLPPIGPTPRPVLGSFALAGSFPGIDGFDASIAVGPTVLVIQTNDFIEIRTKSGPIVDSMSATRFYDPVLVPRTIGTFDGILEYDPRSARFFHVAATRTDDRACAAGTCVSALYFAVSKTDTPRSLGPSDWYKYALDNSVLQDTPTDSWGDMDGIAINDEVVVLTTNVSAYRDDQFRGKKLRILEKAPLLRGEPITRWRDVVIRPEDGADEDLVPLVPHGDPTRLFFLSPEPLPRTCDIRVWALNEPLTAPTLTWRTAAYPGPCIGGPRALQPAGPPLDLPGQWPRPVHRRGSIWGASRIGVGSVSGPMAAIRWFEIDVRTWPNNVRVLQNGVVAADGVSYMYPSIAVAPSGDMALAFLRSGASEFVSAAYTGRLAGDPQGTLRPTALVKAGEGVHDCRVSNPSAGGALGQNKVSDYTGMAIDVADGSAWMLVHYVSSHRCVVPTWLGRVDWSLATAAASGPSDAAAAPGTLALVDDFAGTTGTAPFSDGAPAPVLAAGPRGLILSTSDRIELRERTGAARSSATLADFYSSVRPPGSELKNPFLLYDGHSSRFFHVASTVASGGCPSGGCSRVLVAVSRDAAPQTFDTADWFFYAFDWTLEPGERNVFEYGRLGVGTRHVVVTAKTDPGSASGPGRAVAKVVDKEILLRGEAVTRSTDLFWPEPNLALSPVRALDPSEAVYLLSRDVVGGSCGLTLWRIEGPLDSPRRSSVMIPARRECARAPDVPQPGVTRPLDIRFEPIRLDAVYHGGSIWGAQTVPATAAGAITAAVRWFEIDVTRWPDGARFVQDATISSEGSSYFYPSITVGEAGRAALILVRAGPREFASLVYTGRLADDPPNTMRPLAVLRRGTGPVACADHTSVTRESFDVDYRNRFAFQSSTAIDPVDGSAWLFGQYARAGATGCEFATWVGRVDWSIAGPR